MNTDKLKIKITDEIFNAYTRQGFGRLLKAEIDLIMFDFALKLIFLEERKDYFIDSELNYFMIDKNDLYSLSKKLKITESKISSNIEQVGLLKGMLEDNIGLLNFKNLLLKQKQDQNKMKNGYLSIQVTNKLLKYFIEAKISEINSQYIYDKDSDLISFNIFTFIHLFDTKNEDFIFWIEQQNDLFNQSDIKEIKRKLIKEKLSIKDIGVTMSKGVLSKLIGKGSDNIIDELLTFIDKKDL